MKKRILLLLLVVALALSALSLYSCSNGKDGSSNPNDTGENTSSSDGSEPNKPLPNDHSTVTKHSHETFNYWLYTPDTTDEDIPLIVYLHDDSDGGGGIDSMIKNEGLTKALYDTRTRVNAYVLMPNLVVEGKTWYSERTKLETLIS